MPDVENGAEPVDEHAGDLAYRVLPLDRWMKGTLTLHFVGGGSVEEVCSRHTADQVNQVFQGHREGDDLAWSDLHWITLDVDKIGAITWHALPDFGYPIKAEAREALAAAGHPHGVIPSLVGLWQGRRLPAYSAFALAALQEAAVQTSAAEWARVADAWEGEKGTRLLRAGWEQYAGDTADNDATEHAATDRRSNPSEEGPHDEASDDD